MIDGPALLLSHLGATACTWVEGWMTALGDDPTTLVIRVVAAMGLLVLSGIIAGALLLVIGRLIRLLPNDWHDAVRAALPSIRLIALVLVAVISAAPFFGSAPLDERGVATGGAPLPALVTTWLASALIIIASGNLLFRLVHATGLVAMARAQNTTSAWDDVLIEVAVRVLLGFIILWTVYVAIAVLGDHPVSDDN